MATVVLLAYLSFSRPAMTAGLNHGRFFQQKFFNRWSIKSVTIYRPNKSKIYVFNGNGNNSILANGGLTYYRTGRPNYEAILDHFLQVADAPICENINNQVIYDAAADDDDDKNDKNN